MSSEPQGTSQDSTHAPNPVITARNLSKCYNLYANPRDRLKQMLWRGRRRFYQEFWALQDISFEVGPGEVLGIVGRNGAGKSTLLKLICDVLAPTSGDIAVQGRVSALLELGAGFNPEFSGRENVFMNAAILGLSHEEIAARYQEIVDFSGISDFIDQPVKTYSTGMFLRLAFSVATSLDPDVLVIDEILSVGDGAFARKSFDRIMDLKDEGRTILFCSHSTYQVEALCRRAIWLDHGKIKMLDDSSRVICEYNADLARELAQNNGSQGPGWSCAGTGQEDRQASGEGEPSCRPENGPLEGTDDNPRPAPETASFDPLMSTTARAASGCGRIVRVWGESDGVRGTQLTARSGESDVAITVEFAIDPALPRPTVALSIENSAGILVSSLLSQGVPSAIIDEAGQGRATVVFPKISLMRGKYHLSVFIGCERALHPYDSAIQCLTLDVSQNGSLQGVVNLPNSWRSSNLA